MSCSFGGSGQMQGRGPFLRRAWAVLEALLLFWYLTCPQSSCRYLNLAQTLFWQLWELQSFKGCLFSRGAGSLLRLKHRDAWKRSPTVVAALWLCSAWQTYGPTCARSGEDLQIRHSSFICLEQRPSVSKEGRDFPG